MPRNDQLAPADTLAIQLAFLTESDISVKKLAERFGRGEPAIRAALRGPQYEAVRAKVQAEVVEDVQAILRRNGTSAAQKWVEALEVAAAKGDHKAARDLLIAAKVIEAEAAGPAITVNFGVKVEREG